MHCVDGYRLISWCRCQDILSFASKLHPRAPQLRPWQNAHQAALAVKGGQNTDDAVSIHQSQVFVVCFVDNCLLYYIVVFALLLYSDRLVFAI